MALEQTQRICHCCQGPTLAARPGVPHTLYLVLTFFTLGFGLVFWAWHCLIQVLNHGGWRCQRCGSKV
ncbi:MAG: hypothetical protein JO152_10020 [Mycobacteriaceae bacterium]|nr:hypothetical protein [Mycobacteriaceae bacterium]